jgi:DNA-binding PadR family transcriptional regulator
VSAKHALLGLLLQRPAYRYQLGDRLEKRLGPAWRLNPGQLYQAVDQLRQDGLVERVSGASDQEVYATTEAGAEEFDRWFEKHIKATKLRRRPHLVKVALAGPERLDRALGQLGTWEQECADLLKELSLALDEIPMPGLRVRAEHELLRYALRGDVFSVEGELRYVRFLREKLLQLKEQNVIWPSTLERSPAKKAGARQSAREELFEQIAQRRQTEPRHVEESGPRKRKATSRTNREGR